MAERSAFRYWSSDYITSTFKKKKIEHEKAWKCFRHEYSRNCVKRPESGPVQTRPYPLNIRVLVQDVRAPGSTGTHPEVPTRIACRPKTSQMLHGRPDSSLRLERH